MPMYNLLEYSKNYRKTTGSLWNYYRDERNNPLSSNSESFKYKTSIVGKHHKIMIHYRMQKLLFHLSNFCRSLDIPLINCEVELILTWSKNCVLVYMTVNVTPSGATFKITDTNCMFQLLLCQKKMTQNF